MQLPGWTREPLVHFIGLGALVYVALTWGGETIDPSSRVIAVDQEQQAQLALSFERQMGRAPTDAELDARIEQYVRSEVLYREALRLGLDQGDAVVRQRMVSKMDMSASVAAETAEPGAEVLQAYYQDNAARYAGGAVISFQQAFFENEGAARSALSGGAVSGDAISLPRSFEDATLREVQSVFGEQFSRGLAALELSESWQGPIPSGFGWHVVRLQSRDTEPADFEAVRDRVESDWRSAEIEARKTRAFAVLRSAYRIEIDR